MARSFLSPIWYRVAGLTPSLHAHAHVRRHRYRGQPWHVLWDGLHGTSFRLRPGAYRFVARLDGATPVEQAWTESVRESGEEAPSQDEIISLLASLHASDLIRIDVAPDAREIFERRAAFDRRRRLGAILNPLSAKVPVWRPDPVLNRLKGIASAVFSRTGGAVWLATVVPALVLACSNWGDIAGNLSDRILAAENLAAMAVLYLAVKVLHEMGHALATKAQGGEVPELGVMFLVFYPMPYVDASAASFFRSRGRRVLVGAAGMLVELWLAAIATYLWLALEPGLLRATCLNVMLVAGVSTLLFNGNPLLRFDGYYILADVLEIPNLASRSARLWQNWVARLLGLMVFQPVQISSGRERAWLAAYAPMALAYRLLVTFGVALFVAGAYPTVGIALAALSVVTLLAPLGRGLKSLGDRERRTGSRVRPPAMVAGIVIAAAILLFVVPLPLHSNAEGVVWLPESGYVRAGRSGFVTQVFGQDGAAVKPGDPLVELDDPVLDAQHDIQRWRVAEAQARLLSQQFGDRPKAELSRLELARAAGEFDRGTENQGRLVARSGGEGVFSTAGAQDLLGRYFREGDVIGYVAPASGQVARVAMSQDAIELVRSHLRHVRVTLPGSLGTEWPAHLLRELPTAETELPSKALGTAGGGRFALDPAEQKGVRTLERVFQLDIGLPPEAHLSAFGGRVYVRFEHDPEPLAFRLYRWARQLFLARVSA